MLFRSHYPPRTRLPTIEAVAEGGYGADNAVSPAAVGAGEVVMDTALVRVYQMLGRIKN